jgi:hypothetical protein
MCFSATRLAVGLEPKNNDSMVLHVSYGATSALLEGDAEKAVERRIAALHHPHADLAKGGPSRQRHFHHTRNPAVGKACIRRNLACKHPAPTSTAPTSTAQ